MGSGWSCVGRKTSDGPQGPPAPRESPFGKLQRTLSSRTSASARAALPSQDRTLLALALGAVCESMAQQPLERLHALPPDLAQALIDRLVECGGLDEGISRRLAGLSHHRLTLPSYPGPVTDEWLEPLVNTYVDCIQLAHSAVTDAGILGMGPLSQLKILHLQYCRNLSDTCLSALQGFPQLKELSLVGNEQVTQRGLRWLARCPMLTTVDLELCSGVKELESLRGLVRLRRLNLGWCSNVGDAELDAIHALTSLTHLQLSRTGVTDRGLAALPHLPHLTSLDLAKTGVTARGLAMALPRFPLLRRLSLARCSGVRDGAVRTLCSAAPGLEDLDLACTRVGDAGVAALVALRGLRGLNLEACRLGERGAVPLAALQELTFLDLSDTGVGNASVVEGLASLPRLHTLSLAFTHVDDAGAAALSGLRSLRRLNLDCREVGDAGCAALAALAGLEDLDLHGARVGDAGCAALATLRGLKSLEVCGGRVSDAGVACLAALTALRRLSLAQNTHVTSRSLPTLGALHRLTALNLSQTGVSNGGLASLAVLPALGTLVLHGTRVRASGAARLQAQLPGVVVVGVAGVASPR